MAYLSKKTDRISRKRYKILKQKYPFNDFYSNMIIDLDRKYSLKGKRILDLGGSNIPEGFMQELGVKQFVSLDPISKWQVLMLRWAVVRDTWIKMYLL
ncbi:MAG: hypothetical protein FWE18_02405 [Alphaproteobacteria bacterium]|nr:hypothetical protein [Alphaproteobacteria bacterium]